MTENILSVADLSAGYKKTEIVHDISFALKKGEVVGLVGLNGAGKTTLIKTLVGLREPQKGKIQQTQGDIAFLPERFEAPIFLTGFEYIQFYLNCYKQSITLDEAQKHAQTISLDSGALNRKIKTYSKGMRQKIGILATMLANVPLKILDEPMSGLDPKARHEVKSLIKQAAANGDAILMSSHILSDVSVLCDKVIVVDQGRVLFDGTPAELTLKTQEDQIEDAFLTIIGQKKV